MKTLFKWFLMLSKRLYKKPTFLAVLVVLVLCVLALNFASQQQSGFLKIVLAQHDNADPLSNQIVTDLLADRSLIQFTLAESPEAALKTVTTGGADCAWIFPADMQAMVDRFVERKTARNAVVQVVERETTVFTRIAAEKLNSIMFRHCAQAEYFRFIRADAEKIAHLSDEELLEYYNAIALTEELFTFENSQGDEFAREINYMVAPVRGVLAIMVCLCGAAAAAYYLQDRQRGTFSLVKEHMRPLVAFACIMIAVLQVGLVAMVALEAAGLMGNVLLELATTLLYCVCCAGFWLLMMEIFSSAKWLCATVPILVLVMVAICPVFFRLAELNRIGHLLPPSYYVHGAYDPWYLVYMLGYALLTMLAAAGLHWVKDKIRQRR